MSTYGFFHFAATHGAPAKEALVSGEFGKGMGMNLSSEEWQRINDCLLRLYREPNLQKLNHLIMEILEELVPTGSVVLNYIKFSNHSAILFPENLATPEQVAAVGRYFHQSPLATYFLTTQDRFRKMITDFIPVEDFHKLGLHRIALKPLGINRQFGGLSAENKVLR